jgi:hypothetical protein
MKRLLLIAVCLFAPAAARAQQPPVVASSGNPVLSYTGFGITGAMESISYGRFEGTTWRESSESAIMGSGTAFFQLYGTHFMGECTLGGGYESGSSDAVTGPGAVFTSSVRYRYRISEAFSLHAGPGVYGETFGQPGGGLMLSLGSALRFSDRWLFVFNITASYGNYGAGDDSTKAGIGAFMGFARQFGKY